MTDRDPVVARALATLTPPEHRPGFWAELDRRIAAGEAPTALAHPDEDDMPMHPAFRNDPNDPNDRNSDDPNGAARRRAQASRLRWLAAAALVVAVVASVAVLAARPDDRGTVVVDQPTTTAPPSTTTSAPTTSAPTTAPTGPPFAAAASPDEAVARWLQAVGESEVDAALALTGPRSRAAVEAGGGEIEALLQVSAEGHGTWAAVDDRSSTEVEVADDIVIVVISGNRTAEGMTEFRTDAYPTVRTEDGGWLVEPWAYDFDGTALEIVRPARDTGLPPDATVEVAPLGDGRYFFSLDDGEVVDNGASPVWDPPGAMSSQTHLLVAAYVDGDTLTAAAATFLVEG